MSAAQIPLLAGKACPFPLSRRNVIYKRSWGGWGGEAGASGGQWKVDIRDKSEKREREEKLYVQCL